MFKNKTLGFDKVMTNFNKKQKILFIFCIIIFFVFLLLWLFYRPVKNLDNQTLEPPVGFLTNISSKTLTENIVKKNDKGYTTSFSDIFSSQVWLNNQQTDFFWDYSMTALIFEPNYELQLKGDCQANQQKCQSIDNFILPEKVCSTNNGCLELFEDNLKYNGQQLNLPEKGEIINLAFALFNNRWLISGVKKISDQQYQPLAWWFNNGDFQLVELPNNELILTKHPGRLAIGVSKESALVLYSAYEGRAWQINNQEIRDLGHLFGIRVNNGGFWPKIISSGDGKSTNWYVFDQSGSDLVFLKFWQNGTSWIEGGVSLTQYLPKGSRAAYFFPTKNEKELLIKIVNNSRQSKLWSFLDLGFKKEGVHQVTSINLTDHDQNKREIIGAVIRKVEGGLSGFTDQWSLSANGLDWSPVNLGQELYFASSSDKIFWRYQIKASSDNFSSPFIKMITLHSFIL